MMEEHSDTLSMAIQKGAHSSTFMDTQGHDLKQGF